MAGKPKPKELKDRINQTPEMTVVFNGDGSIKSVEGGGHPSKMLKAEFKLDDSFLDCRDYPSGHIVSCILDMKSYTLLTLEIRDKTGQNPKIVNYLWESTRHWW